jgi:hypothetical protein
MIFVDAFLHFFAQFWSFLFLENVSQKKLIHVFPERFSSVKKRLSSGDDCARQ